MERKDFVDYFCTRKEHYYTISDKECSNINWVQPVEKPCVLIFHDESTFRCGEQQKKRWHCSEKEPFISKGRGKSLMVSDFMVAHPSGPFFSLTDIEMERCINKYPSVETFHGINYLSKTCTGSIQPGQDSYFNSETILNQFERLFQMLEFKTEFNFPVKQTIEIIVDNARTHTAQLVNINDFR